MERKQRSAGVGMRARAAAGFTLLEMLIVVVILGLIAVLVVNNLGGRSQKAKVDLAKVGVANVATWVEQFNLDVGRYPTAAEGLSVLLTKPQNAPEWRGPYPGKTTMPKDPWNNDYIYEWDATNNWFVIKSLGADGQPGGQGDNADITNRA